jgi:hypothetical protein
MQSQRYREAFEVARLRTCRECSRQHGGGDLELYLLGELVLIVMEYVIEEPHERILQEELAKRQLCTIL